MKVAVFALGSRGDVQPYLALARGLAGRGHDVRLVSHENFAPLAADHGLAFRALPGDVEKVVRGDGMRGLAERGNFLAITLRSAREARRAALAWAREGLEAARGVDRLVAGVGGAFLAYGIAEKLDLPLVRAYVFPFTPTRAFPAVALPSGVGRLGGGVNRLSHVLFRQILWQGSRPADTAGRERALGLPPAPFFGPYGAERFRRHPVLYGFSRHIVPPPTDWRDAIVTGYWFLGPPPGWRPPPRLEAFLAAGAPPVYVGFGSMSSRDPRRTADLVLAAIARSGVRAVVQAGWAGLRTDEAPEGVHFVDSLPHGWLFERVAGVVHHGGAGTTAAGLRAGVPTAVVPFFGDQGFWGERVHALGVGPAPVPRKRLTAETLATVLGALASDGAMRRRARALGVRVRAEDGIGKAVDAIERL